MLRSTILGYVALKCCDRLAGALEARTNVVMTRPNYSYEFSNARFPKNWRRLYDENRLKSYTVHNPWRKFWLKIVLRKLLHTVEVKVSKLRIKCLYFIACPNRY